MLCLQPNEIWFRTITRNLHLLTASKASLHLPLLARHSALAVASHSPSSLSEVSFLESVKWIDNETEIFSVSDEVSFLETILSNRWDENVFFFFSFWGTGTHVVPPVSGSTLFGHFWVFFENFEIIWKFLTFFDGHVLTVCCCTVEQFW